MNLKYIYLMGITLFLSLLMTDISFAERGYGLDEFDDRLDEFDDLELESLVESLDSLKKIPAKKIDKGQGLILFDDNLYLLDDDFDLDEDELELQKLELDPNEMETAKEYEDSLDVFFEDSTQVGTSSSSQPNHPIQKQPKRSTPPTTTFRPTRGALRFRSTPHLLPLFAQSEGANGFGVSTTIGAIMPLTTSGISIGYNFGILIDTPISFNIAGIEGNVGTEINFSSMIDLEGVDNITLTNIIGNFSLFPHSSIEIRTGLGFAPRFSKGYLNYSTLSIPVDVIYYLPMNFSGFKFAWNLHAQKTFGGSGSTDFLYLGFLIQFYQSFFN